MSNNNYIPSGHIRDNRPPVEKAKDYTHEKLYSGLPAYWRNIDDKSTWRLTSQRNQSNSNSCVMQASVSGLEVFIKEPISASVYKLRKNAPNVGMYNQNAGDILYDIGTYFEKDVPSQNISDKELDSIELPQPTIIKATGYRTFIDYTNIDKIAEAIQAYGNCVISFGSNSNEWQIQPEFNGHEPTFYHAIVALDFGMLNGEKVLICRDSAGQWSSPEGYRIITQNMLQKRATGAIYYLGAKIEKPIVNPETGEELPNFPKDAPKPPFENDAKKVFDWHRALTKWITNLFKRK